MWFGELITERGIGNGMSLLMFVEHRGPHPGRGRQHPAQRAAAWSSPSSALFGLVIIVGVVFLEQGQRRIPVQYAKRMVGRRMYGGTSTYLPMKVNQAGVIPVIFASSLLYLPDLITRLTGNTEQLVAAGSSRTT